MKNSYIKPNYFDSMAKRRRIQIKNGREVLLRHIERSDVDWIWENFNQVVDEGKYLPTFEKVVTEYEKTSWWRDLRMLENLCLVAEDENIEGSKNIVGQVTIEDIQWEASDHVAVLGIIVRKDYRNQGLGYELIKYALEEAEKINKEKVTLSVFATNESAIQLYKKIGFKTVGIREKQFFMDSHYIDEVLMEIWLSDAN